MNIFDPKTNKVFATGVYENPYWLIEFKIDKKDLKKRYVLLDAIAFDANTVESDSDQNNEIKINLKKRWSISTKLMTIQ